MACAPSRAADDPSHREDALKLDGFELAESGSAGRSGSAGWSLATALKSVGGILIVAGVGEQLQDCHSYHSSLVPNKRTGRCRHGHTATALRSGNARTRENLDDSTETTRVVLSRVVHCLRHGHALGRRALPSLGRARAAQLPVQVLCSSAALPTGRAFMAHPTECARVPPALPPEEQWPAARRLV